MKVAVIGAGFSGMLAAYLLEKEGIDVTVYEKNNRIGGHCSTLQLRDTYTELGTTFSFSKYIKELLLELQVEYTEQFIHRSFLDKNLSPIEQVSKQNIPKLLNELEQLAIILEPYEPYLKQINYGYVPDELLMTLDDFLKKHDLQTIRDVVAPHLSSFGFGNVHSVQAYYTFKVFGIETINTFIRGEKLLFIKKGTTELINKLSENISDIRYSLEVINVASEGHRVVVETPYDTHYYDKVLITTKLPSGVIKDSVFNHLMKKIDTNPFITCAYETSNKSLPTTYYKDNLGKEEVIQFFHSRLNGNQTNIVAFAYGKITPELITNMSEALMATGIKIRHLITAKQWYIFLILN